MTDQHEPDHRDPDDVLELIDTRGALPKVIIERNGRALDTAFGAGKLPPEIRNIGRELPAAGDTAPVARTVPAEHSSTVTLQQAVERSGVSIATWRRRLAQGKVAGAYKAAGAAGEQWYIPVTALDQVAVIKAAPVISAETEQISDLQRRLDAAENQLALQRALADERLKALDQLHATMRALGAGLQAETVKPKRWWQRS